MLTSILQFKFNTQLSLELSELTIVVISAPDYHASQSCDCPVIILTTMNPTGDFVAFLNGKPTLNELFQHVSISTKWYQFGVVLEINSTKLDSIDKDYRDSNMKALKMFDLWLSSNPSASRKQIIDTLKTEAIGENTVAEEYWKTLIKSKTFLCIYNYVLIFKI